MEEIRSYSLDELIDIEHRLIFLLGNSGRI